MRRMWELATCGIAAIAGAGLVSSLERGAAQERKVQVDVPRQGENAEDRQVPADHRGFYRATELIGSTVQGGGKEELGTVRDLVVNGETQQVQYLLLSNGQAADTPSDEFVALPFSVVRPQFVADGSFRFFSTGFTRQQFVDAPRITAANLIDFRNNDWMVGTDRFFGVTTRTRVGQLNGRSGHGGSDTDLNRGGRSKPDSRSTRRSNASIPRNPSNDTRRPTVPGTGSNRDRDVDNNATPKPDIGAGSKTRPDSGSKTGTNSSNRLGSGTRSGSGPTTPGTGRGDTGGDPNGSGGASGPGAGGAAPGGTGAGGGGAGG